MSRTQQAREQHENATTERREKCFRLALMRHWEYWSEKLKKHERIDFVCGPLITPNVITTWLEVKCRKEKSTTYPDVMLTAAKWITGINNARATGTRFVLAFYWRADRTSVVLCIDPHNPPQIELRWGGRTVQTRDDYDIETVAHIDLKLFHKIRMPDPFTGATPEETW